MTSAIALGARWAPWPGGEVAGIPAHLRALCGLLRVTSISELPRAIGEAPVVTWLDVIAMLIESSGHTADTAAIERVRAVAYVPLVYELAALGGGLSRERVAALMDHYAGSKSTLGAADITIAGKRYTVRLTMGAVVRMSRVLRSRSIADLIDDLASPALRSIAEIISALLAGNGHEVAVSDVSNGVSFHDYRTIIMAVLDVGNQARAAAWAPH